MAYKYYVSENKVVCISSFAKKPVRGLAKCDPKDTFNVDSGKKLARLRCDVKVSAKRKQRAIQKLEEARATLAEAEARVAKMQQYLVDSTAELAQAEAELAEYVATL